MSSYIATVAEAIKDVLNAAQGSSGSITMEFTAERVYTPEKDFSTINDLTVTVFALAAVRTRETRRDQRKEIEVHTIYAKKIDQLTDPDSEEANAAIDEMMELGEQIADTIFDAGRVGDSEVSGPVIRVEQEPLFDFELLRTHRVFVGLVRAFVILI